MRTRLITLVAFLVSSVSQASATNVYVHRNALGCVRSDGSLRLRRNISGNFQIATVEVSLTQPVTAVPLPSALPLFASGLAGLGWLSRRRKHISWAGAPRKNSFGSPGRVETCVRQRFYLR
jgi:hypothetical protein